MDREIATAFASLTTGIYVLSVADGEHHHGMSSSWVTQVSGEPPLFTAAVDNNHFSCGALARTAKMGFNIVGAHAKALEDYFYSSRARRPDNLTDIEYELSPILGVPWLKQAMVSIEARITNRVVAGDHTIFVAAPAGVRVRSNERPLTSLELDYVYLGGREVLPRDRSGW